MPIFIGQTTKFAGISFAAPVRIHYSRTRYVLFHVILVALLLPSLLEFWRKIVLYIPASIVRECRSRSQKSEVELLH